MGQCVPACLEFLTSADATVQGSEVKQAPAEKSSPALTLDEIARKYRTDKSSRYHNYAQFYDRILSKVRLSRVRMLEVGIGTVEPTAPSSMVQFARTYKPGASLRMWSEYFPQASIIAGIDNQEDCMFREGNIRTALADSRCSESVARAMAQLDSDCFDIILDDGLHEQLAQVDTLRSLKSRLSPNGVYIIEDIRRPVQLLEKLKSVLPDHTFHVESLAKLNPKKRLADSNIIVILPAQLDQIEPGSAAHSAQAALLCMDNSGDGGAV